ncbi:Beta-fructofuranosidase [Durusdinium trenchii]|uniref:Insoluble isoenzyme 1 (Cell wall beta-fructosidase 1) (Invertase 1) (Sucrose hydrolase 1) n=1 Tax=Durusdinium trenchii TaxID=1381693 RepID=A0ABP0LK87_9DINO
MACSLAIRLPLLASLSFIFITRQSNTCTKNGQVVPCWPGQEACGEAFKDAPIYHLMSQKGCAENDPNGPVFDPVHGVIHHFYQNHLAIGEGHGPIYGHFVSKDFVHWTEMPVAIWNGLDSSFSPPRLTTYDTVAIYTGSAVVVDGAGPAGQPGVVQIYPGLCDAGWPLCLTGTLLAQAVPADYAGDELLTNWTKPLYNPVMENTQRDPSTPWKEANGEWRLRTYDAQFYAASSDLDLLGGRWRLIGTGDNISWPVCECPSFFPLPGPTEGFEKEYHAATVLPSHVQKLSCGMGNEEWMIGTYVPDPWSVGKFQPTKGWEELWFPQRIDAGAFYASKDNVYPSKGGGPPRRVLWGWAVVPPQSTQSLPRVLTFNAAARQLEQAPLPELKELRKELLTRAAAAKVSAWKPLQFRLPFRSALYSETLVRFALPNTTAIFRVGYAPSHSFSWMESVYFTGKDQKNYTQDAGLCQETCEQAGSACVAWSFVPHVGETDAAPTALRRQLADDPPAATPAAGRPNMSLEEVNMSSHTEKVGPLNCHLKKLLDGNISQKGAVSGVNNQVESLSCAVFYEPVTGDFGDMSFTCGDRRDTLRLLRTETHLELRLFADATFLEVYFQNGRRAVTVPKPPPLSTELHITSTVATTMDLEVYSMKSIWVSEEYIRKQPRIFAPKLEHSEDLRI